MFGITHGILIETIYRIRAKKEPHLSPDELIIWVSFAQESLISYLSFISFEELLIALPLSFALKLKIWKVFWLTKGIITNALVFSLKFISIISLLVFVRGGVPRYRYDFLTKMGWLKLLSLTLAYFLSVLLLITVIA